MRLGFSTLATAGLAVLMLPGCGGSGSATPLLSSGVRGVVVNGNPDKTTQPRAGATVTVYLLGELLGDPLIGGRHYTEVATLTADADGRFQVALAPGEYVFIAQTPPGGTPGNGVRDPDDICTVEDYINLAENQVADVTVGHDFCYKLPIP